MGSCSIKDLMEVDSTVSPPTEGWQSIQSAFNTPSEVPKFSLSNTKFQNFHPILSQEQQLMAKLQVTLNLLTNQLKIFFNVTMYKPWQSLKRMNIGGLRMIVGQK